jgi:hypothetical protein
MGMASRAKGLVYCYANRLGMNARLGFTARRRWFKGKQAFKWFGDAQ